MKKMLTALFNDTSLDLVRIVLTDAERGSEFPFNLTCRVDGERVWVTGEAQEVMFLIGAFANHGFDTLQIVTPA